MQKKCISHKAPSSAPFIRKIHLNANRFDADADGCDTNYKYAEYLMCLVRLLHLLFRVKINKQE